MTQCPLGGALHDDGFEVPEAHDHIQRDGWTQVVSVQPQVPQLGKLVVVMRLHCHHRKWAELRAVNRFNVIVVEIQVFQMHVEHRHSVQIVVGQMQIQEGGHIEDPLGDASVTQLVVVKADEGQVVEVLEVIRRDVLNVVSIQEKLVDVLGNITGHLP